MSGDENARLSRELSVSSQRIAELELENARLRSELRAARDTAQRARDQVVVMRSSLAWRLGYPARVLRRALRPTRS